ncbi:MAG: hypothetical protein MUO67_04370 [Anaerolineales bacterium]|nr:hypothetical protein [Anaerolineales bacterium]
MLPLFLPRGRDYHLLPAESGLIQSAQLRRFP